jgi:hypothetical protein
MNYGKCAHCGRTAYLNSNNLCDDCSKYPGIYSPAPKYGVCKCCGKAKSDLNSDGVCSSCNSGHIKGLW